MKSKLQSTNPEKSMSYLNGAVPCKLPLFEHPTSAETRPTSTPIDLIHADCLRASFIADPERTKNAVSLAFGLLLRIFVGQDDVSFAYQDVTLTDDTPDLTLLRVLVEKCSLIKDLTERVGQLRTGHDQILSTSLAHLSNTALIFNHYVDSFPERNPGFPLSLIRETNQFILCLEIRITSDEHEIFLHHNSSTIFTEQALNIASSFDKLLNEILTRPNVPVAELNYLSERNIKGITAWNSRPLEVVDRCIHEFIHDQALSKPHAEAVCDEHGTISYRDLDRISSRLASYLVTLGLGSGVFVPLCFEKEVWNVICMIAVLKTGAAFVPLDPTAPVARLQALSTDVGATVILCSQRHAGMLLNVAAHIIPVDGEMIGQLPTPNGIDPTTKSSDLAYVIFTSGTTGQPKGTMIEHRSFCSGAKAHAPAMLINSKSRVLQFAAHTFDASLVEILTTLMEGGVVCIPSEDQRLNNITLAMNEMRVNWAVLTPSFVGFITPSDVPHLKTLTLAGEAMSEAHIATWSHINLINGYGPSECSVAAVVNSHVTPGTSPNHIGTATGCHLWIVDPANYNCLVPVGCVGELLVQGPTLARGYLGQNDTTFESFISSTTWAPACNADTQSWRFYKTGDLVRQCHDGTLMFVGRDNTQVKVHGQRVELGEVEHHLNIDPDVKHALVVLPKSGPLKARLIAVMSFMDCDIKNPAVLKLVKGNWPQTMSERLLSRIPSHMVPSMWLVVESVPSLPSGKLDRKQTTTWVENMDEESYRRIVDLAQPDPQAATAAAEPTTEMESKLRQVWSNVLNLELDHIGLESAFLSLGGDSISAMQVKGQCVKKNIALTVQEILRSKSIKQLAQCAKVVEHQTHREELLDRDFDLSPIQKLFFELPNQGQGHFNQSFFLRVSRSIQKKDLRAAIEILIQRHSMLRARFEMRSKGWQQRVTQSISSSYRLKTYHIDDPTEALPAISDSQTCLNPTSGPLFAVDLFDVDGGEQLLFMVGHHLVIDLVSWRIILEDLEELLVDPNSVSTQRPLSFQTWCQMQAEQCQKLAVDKVIPLRHVPTSNYGYWGMADDQPNTYGNVTCEGFEVDATTTSKLLTQCHESLRTETIDLLLASLIHSFSLTFTDRSLPAVYNEGHGRETSSIEADLSRTVGWFTIMYPVCVPEAASTDLLDTVREVKDFRRKLPENGRHYFSSRCLTDEGRSRFGQSSTLEIAFNYLGQYQQLERKGALLTPVEEMAGEARGAGTTADVGHDTPRFGLFEISAVVVQGKLRFSFTFNRNMKHQDKISTWISACQDTMSAMAEALLNMEAQATPGDFPLLSLTNDSFNAIINDTLPTLGISRIDAVEDIYPCSSMQEGLLISQTKSSAFYAVQIICELKTRRDIQASCKHLEYAWQKIVERHPLLRTVFIDSVSDNDGLYDQVVLKQVSSNVVTMTSASESEALSTLAKKSILKYDNSKPAHRFTLCETPEAKIFCKLEISHAIMDGTSMSILFQDLAAAYENLLPSSPGPLYSNYISYLQNQPDDMSLEYWKSYLSEIEPCTFPLLNDGRVVEKELRTKRLDFRQAQFAEMQDFCDSNGVTLSNVMHTAWGLTLRIFTDSQSPCFGYLTSGRDAPVEGIQDAVGPFINILVCRMSMAPASRLGAILNQVQKDYIESLPHRSTSLAEVQHALQLSGAPLFNTALSYRRLPTESKKRDGNVHFTERVPIYDPTEYDISVNIEVSDEIMAIDLDYWTNYISDGQAANIGSTFMQCLRNIVAHSSETLESLSYFSEENYDQVLEWNAETPTAVNDCVHKIIEQQAQLQPTAQAVCGFDANFTYAELDDISTQLAFLLSGMDIGPETFVPTCFDKSSYAIVSMLSVLKTGAGAVPLDATHPRSALELRVRETNAKVVLVSPSRAEIFADMDVHVIPVCKELLDSLPSPDKWTCPTVKPENPAFVIFTSGSTGKPKGVVLENRAICSSGLATGSAYGWGPGTRVLQFASYTFDNSLAEIFITLMRGGTVCVPSEHDRFNNLAEIINKLEVNFMDITPTVASFLRPSDVPNLKGLSLGGEPLTKDNIEIWGKAVALHCCYGPSECSINSTWNGDLLKSTEATNIGRSIGSVSWITDPSNYNRLVPIGCVGELLIEGPILARGYLNDPEKTSKAFINNPAWASGCGRRFYCTGDLARFNSDSTITYLGRKDTQVKLNGQRLELGEIEHHVKRHLTNDVQSAVELIQISTTAKALAIFLCLGSEDITTPDDFLLPMSDVVRQTSVTLEAALSATLPSYMIPSVYLPVSSMPMTSSGKLDRRRLRTACQLLSGDQIAGYKLAQRTGRLASTPMEKRLANLWEEVLKLEYSVGADDNFFKCTGDSITAMKLITAARSSGIALTVADIFQKPTLSELATAAKMLSGVDTITLPPISEPFTLLSIEKSLEEVINEVALRCRVEVNSIQDIYPCTSLQQGLIALSNKDPGAYVAQNIYRLPHNINLNKFRAAWEKVVEAENILRTRIVYTETLGFLQVVTREPILWHELTSLSALTEGNRHLPSYNGGLLSQYIMIETPRNEPRFVWTAHHAIYDGWCIPLILERVEACYHDINAVDLALGPAYPQFIKYITEINASESGTFWCKRLSEPTAAQFPALPNPTYHAHATSVSSYTTSLTRETGSHITLASVIRASWALVLATYSGNSEVIFGETLTGRDAPVLNLANIIGPTLATVPTRIKIGGTCSIGKFLEDIQHGSAEAIPYQYSGLQNIKHLNEDTAIACGFQNLLAVHHDSKETTSGFWDMQSSGTKGTNFYSYPLTVSCQIGKGQVDIDAHYDKDVISTWLVQQMLRQFAFVLGLLNRSDTQQLKLGQLRILNPEDEQAILSGNSEPLKVVNKCIHEIIGRQAVQQPKWTLAVDSWDAKFSYWELDRLSTQLAHYLADQKLRGGLIPLCFDKSAYTICAMLAVLKCGAAFVPLDPGAPVARLRDVISDTHAKVILCSPRLQGLCASVASSAISIDLEMIERLPDDDKPLPPVDSESVAYIIYTSGSTGKPKTTLTLGGCVCVPDEESRMNRIADVINDMAITWTLLTPSFVQTIQPSTVPTLKRLVLGGEAMSQTHLSNWADKLQLLNAYGPSETSIIATVNPRMTLSTDPVNMGRAVGAYSWITDKLNPNRLVPIGSIGELVIEGPILARGYLNNESKTEEVFIEDPEWSLTQDQPTSTTRRRFYRTGDLVRYEKDKSLIFCGRHDGQAKIRGQRVELGEIEVHLRTDPAIQHALVTIPKSGFCKKRLVSIVSLQELAAAASSTHGLKIVIREASAFYLTAIRERLCDLLPAYMIPSNWIIVQSLPLLPSGKLDRKCIERWVEDMSSDIYHQISDLGHEKNVGNGTTVELQLRAIWGAALNLPPDKIGFHQNFLSVGGDSISAMQVMSNCRAEGLGLTVQDIIQSKSIAQLALKVTLPESQDHHEEELDSLFDLSPIQKLYFKCVGENFNHFNQSVRVRLTRNTTPERMAFAVESLVLSHSMLRARFFKNEAGEWKQQVFRNVSNCYRFSTATTSIDMVDTLVETSQKSLDIQNGPLFVVDLLNIKGEDYQIVSLISHHLVIDVVSWRIILQDLEDVINTGALKLQTTLPFQTWSRLQLENAQKTKDKNIFHPEGITHADLAYWDMVDKPNVYGDTIDDGFEVDAETTLQLLGRCHESLQTEPVDVFLAAILQSFQKVFADRAEVPPIYNEGHGREPRGVSSSIDVSRTVGWFTTMVPIYLPSGSDVDTDLMSTIRWTKDLRNRLPDKGRPYFAYRLLTEEGSERFAGHWPMEISFNYLGKMQQLERKGSLIQAIQGVKNFDIGVEVPRFALFEISVAVENSNLKVSFSYNRHMKRQAKIRRWIVECQRSFETAAKELLESKPEPTLSNFPLIPLAYSGISRLVEKLPQLGVSSMDEIEDVYPCSPTQQGMLLAQLKDPRLYAYSALFEAKQNKSEDQVDVRLLAEAWQSVVRRHATLRTLFTESVCEDGLTDQVVLKDRTARVSWLESDDLDALSTLHNQQPLNFRDVQPPHRLSLCRTKSNRVFCKLEISHSICDGTSIPILLRDLSIAYRDHTSPEIAGFISTINDTSRDKLNYNVIGPLYSDYIAHVKSNLRDDDINYWKSYLSVDIEPCIMAPLTDGRNENKALRSFVLALSKHLELRAFCNENGLTLSNVLQLAWGMILRLYTGSDNVCFGYLSSGRDAPIRGIQDAAVGAFINMLTCKSILPSSCKLSQALKQIQTDFIHGMAHQTCSLADIQHELGLSGTNLFNTAFTFQKRTERTQNHSAALAFDIVEAHDPSEYDVTVNVEAFDSGVEIHFGYWTTTLSDAQASNLADTFDHVVNTIIEQKPDRIIGDLDFVSQNSRSQILSWNRAPPPKFDKCVHDLVQQQASKRPNTAQAVSAWDLELSYTELDMLSTCLAAQLVEVGVGSETFVPLCFEKTAWAVVSMIAVMKAGGAFVPLDHTHPEGRLQQFIDDVEAKIVLCSRQNYKKMAGISKRTLIVDQSTMDQLDKAPTVLPIVSPDNVAYAIFTSGTTGSPKGTLIEHGAFCTSAVEHSKAMYMHSDSRVFQFASYTFDASVMEILTALIVGGCVCIPSDQDRMNDIPGAIKRMGVTWTLLTPSVASTLSPKSVPSLKTLVTGGEAMKPGHIAKWKGSVALVNAYGPSETSVIASTSIKVDESGNQINTDPSNIGRAVGGRTWIVDPRDYNKLVPVGCIGELVVEGRTVARGYLKNEQKTADAFIHNPFWLRNLSQKERIYRTGDLVRYDSDGSLSFIARSDTQIKLNGQRIELGEIEHHVRTNLPEDYQSAVELVAPMNTRSTKALAAFFSSTSNSSSSDLGDSRILGVDDVLLSMSEGARAIAKHLDSSLATVLPSYMIPSFYIPITKMPWTSSSKLDRQRLRNIVQSLPKEVTGPYRLANSEHHSSTVPMSPIEAKLQKLWEIVLAISKQGSIGLDDNFFRLGGDSVSAMRLVGNARSEGLLLSVMDIFRNPRLCDMATVCTTVVEEVSSALVPFSMLKDGECIDDIVHELVEQCRVPKEQILDVYPCSLLQQGLITLSIKQPGAYVSQNVFLLPNDLDLDRFKRAWQRTVEEVDILRTRIVHMNSSSFRQVVIQAEPIDWKTAASLPEVSDSPVQLPQNNGGALTQYSLVTDAETKECYLVWSIHHALYDGWSLPMVLKRVELAYRDTASTLSKSSYALFIRYLSEVDEHASDEFWRKRLSGSSPLRFPQNQHISTDGTSDNKILSHTISISQNTTSMGITLPTIIRAAWSMVVAAYSGSNDVIFAETLAGRDVPIDGIAEIIGPTFTTVPTRIQVHRHGKILQFLQAIQNMASEIIPYQHAGLQRIKRLDADTELACDLQNLLVVQTAEEDIEKDMWDVQGSGVASNFFTYPLVLECKGSSKNVNVTAHYDEKVLSTWEMQRIMYQLDNVLRQLSDLPSFGSNAVLDEVEVFSAEDRELVRKWNSTEPESVEACIHEEFEEVVFLQPDSMAVDAWDGHFTYAELKSEATRLAYHLIDKGVGPEVFVPICMEKSKWAIVTILSILMAGGAYVPLDPSAPTSRHQEMIKDVNATIIICSPEFSNRYADVVKQVVSVNQGMLESLLAEAHHHKDLLHRATSRASCYAIFTSGSTGRPKGTVVEHRAISTSSAAMRRTLLMKPSSRVFQFASFTFDVSVLETLTALTNGSCICIPSEEQRVGDVAGAIDSLKATWAFLTPSVANMIEPASIPSLEILVCGGEAMSVENVLKWASKVTLVNGYGPTEASVIAIANPDVSTQRDASNIGRALASGHTWVVDQQDHNRIAPVGCVGELLLDGPFLAREYINNKSKTEEVFIERPPWSADFEHLKPMGARPPLSRHQSNQSGNLSFSNRNIVQRPTLSRFQSNQSGRDILHRPQLARLQSNQSQISKFSHSSRMLPLSKMYKTGDLVKYNHDATLTFIGRKDHQMKLHGQRMEPGEIEHVLDRDLQVQHALVLLPKSGLFRSRLVAVLTLTELATNEITKNNCVLVEDGPRAAIARNKVNGVRTRLSESLPSYMVPASWLVVESIPLLPSGKLDRRNVETWLSSSIDEETYERIMNAEEEEDEGSTIVTNTTRNLQDIISRVLNLPTHRVKLAKSFVALGGDSIAAMQVMALCRKEKMNFSLSEVLKSKSIHHLSVNARFEDAVQHKAETFETHFDLLPIQQLYFQSQAAGIFEKDARFNQSFSLEITRRVASQNVDHAIKTMVKEHSMLRARFSKDPTGKWQQRLTQDISSSYRYQTHELDSTSQIPDLVANSQSSLDIQHGPLFVVDLFDIGTSQMLFLAAHHLIIDMVSWRILIQDLEDILNTGSISSEKPLSFQIWNGLQEEYSQRATTQSQIRNLPFTVPTPDISYWGMDGVANIYGDVISESFTIDEAFTTLALDQSHRALRTEPLDLFISAIEHSFARVFVDRRSPPVFNESHGREPWDSSIDLSRTVGWFTSIAPVHVDVNMDDDDVVETVRRTKDNRRKLTGNGRPYFAHQFLTANGRSTPQSSMEIIFNYLGRMQQLEHDDSLLQQWTYPEDDQTSKMIADVGPLATRMALFEISAAVVKGQIQFSFLYNSRMHHQREIRRWVNECRESFEEIVQRLTTATGVPSFTLSDFPLLPINYEGLEKIVSKSLPQVGIKQDEVEDIYPCAPLQEGLLISQLRNPSLYHFHAVFEVRPPSAQTDSLIDPHRLLKAWQRVVDYHGALRTVFADSVYKGDIFNQIVVKSVDSGAILLQCDGSEPEALEKLKTVTILDLNYKKQPRVPHQAVICQTSSGKVYFKAEINHVVIDGASANIMLRDLAAAYHGTLPEGLGPLYSDYVSYIKSHPADESIKFWKSYLEGAKACYFPELNSTSGKERCLGSVPISFGRFSELQDLCKKMNITLANLMQVAWAFCLGYHTKSEDICFGYLTSGRDVPVNKIQSTIGAFINMLVCRIKFTKKSTLKELFQGVQDNYLKSLDHQHCSLAQVQHDLMDGQALFNTAVSIQSGSASDSVENDSISFDPVAAHDPSEYAVTVNIRTFHGDEGVVLRYWSNFISDKQANELADMLSCILDNFIDKPHQLVEDLNVSEVINKSPTDAAQVEKSKDEQPQPWNSETELRTIVSGCVQEIISQLFKSGALISYDPHRLHANINAATTQQVIAAPMIDYSLLKGLPMLEEIEKPERRVKAEAKTVSKWGKVEQKLLSVWTELLQVSEDLIENEANFFELGGDSIVAMQMVGAAREEDLALTVANIFRHPTFADMAATIRVAQDSEQIEELATDTVEYREAHEARSQAIQNAMYQRYSLLEAANVDAFLQEEICPKIRAFRGGILDVYPVTDFQALAVTGTLMESKWMLNYFFLEGKGSLDVKRLKNAIARIVDSFDILRTVFVPYGSRFFQVVLRKLQPSFTVEDTDDLAQFTTHLQTEDRRSSTRLGESFLKFTVARQKGSNLHRIIIRMSHAQYDGVCLPRILAALQAGYRGRDIPSTPSFSSYVRDTARTMTDDHYMYWKDLLKGSAMTEVVQRQGPNYNRGIEAPTTLKRTVQIPSLAYEAITSATIIKSAWSLVLAQLSASPDVIFGNVISGRNAAVVGVESMIGPCVNMIPVRVPFQSTWVVLDLLKHVQGQQIANMPYESLGFREIVKHCTEWPDWTNFSTVCQHQNIQKQTGMQLGGNEYVLGAVGSQEDFADITILSTPQEDNGIEVCLIFTPSSGITLPFAETLFESLCETITAFSSDIKAPLPSRNELSSMQKQVLKQETPKRLPDLKAHLNELSKEELASHSNVLGKAWAEILHDFNSDTIQPPIIHSSSFYSLGGDIIGISQVAGLLENEGLRIRVEDLVDHPLFADQLALVVIAAKVKRERDEEDLKEVYDPQETPKEKKGLKKMWGKSVGGLAKRMKGRRIGSGQAESSESRT